MAPRASSKRIFAFAGGIGCISLIVVIGGFIALIAWGIPRFIGTYVEKTAAVPGGHPEAYKPLAELPEVTAYAGEGALLQQVKMQYVRRDGTLDLKSTGYVSMVDYHFVKKMAEPPKNAPPVGAGAVLEGQWVEPIDVTVQKPLGRMYVRRMGGGFNASYSYIHLGMEKEVDSPTQVLDPKAIALPSCTLTELWDKATEGKPELANAVADITLTAKSIDFTIDGTGLYRVFTPSCEVVR